jgi:predicted dehydrogenase
MSNTPVDLAIVGCGSVAEHKHLHAILQTPGVRIAALVDPDPARVECLGRLANGARRRTLEDVAADPSIQAAAVLVPPAQHAAVARPLLSAGKHVLVEKPITLALEEADELVALARGAAGRTMMAFHMRFHRLVQRARTFILEGGVGTVESIRTVWNSPRQELVLPAWKLARDSGGGALVELGVHHFDLWRHLLDAQVESVYAITRSGSREDTAAMVTAKMTNGVLATGSFSEATSHDIELEISGTRGRLRVSCLRFEGFEWTPTQGTPGGWRTRMARLQELLSSLPEGLPAGFRGGDYMNSFVGLWHGFARCIRGEDRLTPSLEDGREALRVVRAAVESARSGQAVRLRHGIS